MLTLTHEAGYGNIDVEEARKTVRELTTVPLSTRSALMELISDYAYLRQVIDGEGVMFRHPDGSMTRRIYLYGG